MFKIGDRIRSYDFEDRSHDSFWTGVVKEIHDSGWICTTESRMLNGKVLDPTTLPATFGAPKPRTINGVLLTFVELIESPTEAPVEVAAPVKKAKAKKS